MCQIRKTEFWWKFGARVFLLWWKYILFELRKSDSICRWYQIRKIEVIEQTWNKYMLKLKAGNLKKEIKKYFLWLLSVPAGALPGWNFQNISLVFSCIFGVQQYSVSQWLSCEHWQVLVVTRGWDRAVDGSPCVCHPSYHANMPNQMISRGLKEAQQTFGLHSTTNKTIFVV